MHKRVSFRQGPAESLPFLEDKSADLVLNVDALHWFDVAPLVTEMRRVLRDGGVFCSIYFPFGTLDVTEADEVFDKVQ